MYVLFCFVLLHRAARPKLEASRTRGNFFWLVRKGWSGCRRCSWSEASVALVPLCFWEHPTGANKKYVCDLLGTSWARFGSLAPGERPRRRPRPRLVAPQTQERLKRLLPTELCFRDSSLHAVSLVEGEGGTCTGNTQIDAESGIHCRGGRLCTAW